MTQETVVRRALRVEEAAEALGIPRTKCFELIASGELPSIKFGRLRRVPVEALDVLIASRLAAQGVSIGVDSA